MKVGTASLAQYGHLERLHLDCSNWLPGGFLHGKLADGLDFTDSCMQLLCPLIPLRFDRHHPQQAYGIGECIYQPRPLADRPCTLGRAQMVLLSGFIRVRQCI